jgi:hypothetical protein
MRFLPVAGQGCRRGRRVCVDEVEAVAAILGELGVGGGEAALVLLDREGDEFDEAVEHRLDAVAIERRLAGNREEGARELGEGVAQAVGGDVPQSPALGGVHDAASRG